MIEAVLDGQINPVLVLWGYSRGIFPMGDPDTGRIDWYSPDPRAIIDLDRFHIPRTLRPVLRNGRFRVTLNQAFEQVMRACSERESTWITEPVANCYCELYHKGFGHSVEVWDGVDLTGGLYGVAVGGAFFGESMFHTQTNASKVALAALVQQLREQRFELLDIQFMTPHLARFGAEDIPREEYLDRLSRAISKSRQFVRQKQQTVVF
jgi:leucyl/phenylalanyl-tRNA--protein transferase